jgi:putative hydrolase of the HAD superfamily
MLILFDLDDTLLDNAGATRRAVDALRDHLQLDEAIAEFRSRWFASTERHFDRFIAGHVDFQGQRRARIRDALQTTVSDASADELFAVYQSSFEQSWRLFDDVLPCLDALGQHRLGVVTNGNSAQQRHKLARLGILERFACVVVSDECGWAKPDPRIFERACELAGIAAPDAIHVGDRDDIDVLGATRAGLRAAWLDRHGAAMAKSTSREVARLTTLAELPALLR